MAAPLPDERLKWQKAGRDVRAGSATALTDSAVTQGAAVGHANTFPAGRIAYRPVDGQTRAKMKRGYPCRIFINSMP